MLLGKCKVKLWSVMAVTVLMYVCMVTDTAMAANTDNDWSLFDPFAIDAVTATGNAAVEVYQDGSSIQVQPLTRISTLPVRGLGAVPVLRTPAEDDADLRIPPLRIPIRPDLLTPYRPWGGC